MIDPNTLTLGEIAKIEQLAGASIDVAFDDGQPKGKALAAFSLIAARRSGQPAFTWDDAQSLTMAEAMELLGINTGDDAEDTDDEDTDDEGSDEVEPDPF